MAFRSNLSAEHWARCQEILREATRMNDEIVKDFSHYVNSQIAENNRSHKEVKLNTNPKPCRTIYPTY